MPGFDGTGPRGMGPMTGGGRGLCSPGGLGYRGYGGFRGAMYGQPYYGIRPLPFGNAPVYPQMTRQQEIDLLKNEAQAMKAQLEQVESMIQNLEKQP